MKPITKLKWKYTWLSIAGFLSSVIPILTVLILKWDVYTSHSYGGTVKLCVGGMIALVFLFLKVIGKLKMPRRIILYALVFGFAFLMEAILNDLKLLSGMALLGETVDFLFFQTALRKTKEKIQLCKTADATGEKLEELFQKYMGTGGNA